MIRQCIFSSAVLCYSSEKGVAHVLCLMGMQFCNFAVFGKYCKIWKKKYSPSGKAFKKLTFSYVTVLFQDELNSFSSLHTMHYSDKVRKIFVIVSNVSIF